MSQTIPIFPLSFPPLSRAIAFLILSSFLLSPIPYPIFFLYFLAINLFFFFFSSNHLVFFIHHFTVSFFPTFCFSTLNHFLLFSTTIVFIFTPLLVFYLLLFSFIRYTLPYVRYCSLSFLHLYFSIFLETSSFLSFSSFLFLTCSVVSNNCFYCRIGFLYHAPSKMQTNFLSFLCIFRFCFLLFFLPSSSSIYDVRYSVSNNSESHIALISINLIYLPLFYCRKISYFQNDINISIIIVFHTF